jgi:FMN phosphatase YigB (HAD superfamily)
MKNIKNIIFDLGGIFIDIDFSKTDRRFAELGIPNFKDFFTQHTASPLFEDLETGKVTPEEFYEAFRKETNTELSDEQIKGAWNALLGTFPAERLQWLEEIKQRYNIYLFSNTNLIHYYAFQDIYRQCTGKSNFDDYFVRAWYSHDLGLRKPYPESFTRLMEIENLKAEETLFVDDTAKNVEGAKQAGLEAILLPPPKTVFDLEL